MVDPHGTVLLDGPDDASSGRPEVPRGELRRILLESLPEGAVQWGRKLTGVRPLGDGQHELTFADGASVSAGLVVGADGAWSRVRRLLSDVTPAYAGTSFVETYLFDADARHPATARLVGGGALYALVPGKGIVAHREPHGVLHTYVALTRSPAFFDEINVADPSAVKARVAARRPSTTAATAATAANGPNGPNVGARAGIAAIEQPPAVGAIATSASVLDVKARPASRPAPTPASSAVLSSCAGSGLRPGSVT